MNTTRALTLAALSLVAFGPLRATPVEINCDTVWRDSAGEEILAHSGCVLQIDGTFYWYGIASAAGAATTVRCYGSTDLAHWTLCRISIPRFSATHVAVLRAAGEVLLLAVEDEALQIWTASDPGAEYAPKSRLQLPGARRTDGLTAFTDEDGGSYIVYVSHAATGDPVMRCLQFDPARRTLGTLVSELHASSYVQPSLWKREGTYYVTAAAGTPPFSAPTFYATASRLAGPWTPWQKLGRAMIGEALLQNSTYNSRHAAVFELTANNRHLWIYLGDRWSDATHYGVGQYVWLPFTFDGKVPVLNWYRPWYPDVADASFTHALKRYGLWREPRQP